MVSAEGRYRHLDYHRAAAHACDRPIVPVACDVQTHDRRFPGDVEVRKIPGFAGDGGFDQIERDQRVGLLRRELAEHSYLIPWAFFAPPLFSALHPMGSHQSVGNGLIVI